MNTNKELNELEVAAEKYAKLFQKDLTNAPLRIKSFIAGANFQLNNKQVGTGKIVVWKDGTYKEVLDGITYEFENDENWLVTIPVLFNNKQVGAGIWTVVEDRLPDNCSDERLKFRVRNTGRPVNGFLSDLHDNEFQFVVLDGGGKFAHTITDLSLIEWLDETQSQPISFNKEAMVMPYLKSEFEIQKIKLKSLGIDYDKTGITWEQCINTVIYLCGDYKNKIIGYEKQVVPTFSDEEIKTIADIELDEIYNQFSHDYDMNIAKACFIKGAEAILAALQQKSVGVDNDLDFAKWLEENTQVVCEDKITLYRYFDNNEWGNYILEDIYKEYKEKH